MRAALVRPSVGPPGPWLGGAVGEGRGRPAAWLPAIRAAVVAGIIAGSGLTAPGLADAQTPPVPAPGARLQISLLTMSPGDSPFTAYGHTAIRVRDLDRPRHDLLFDYGTYDATAPNAGWRFMRGDLPYWLSVSTFDAAVIWYGRVFSGITEQVLRLDAAQAADLEARLRANSTPQQREYAYHHFLDNCATRPRDLLDETFGGALRRATADTTTEDTFRTLIDAAMRRDPVPRWVIYGLLNARIDVPISRWRRMFLPSYLRDELQSLRIEQPGGEPLPVVVQRSVLQGEDRPAHQPAPSPWAGLIACALILGLAGAPLLFPAGRLGRIWAGSWLALWGTLAGAYGVVLAIAWAVSPYPETKWNGNVLAYHPLLLLLLPLGVGLAVGSPRALRAARWVLSVAVVGVVSAWLLDLTGVTQQQIWRIGIAAGCALGPPTVWLWRRPRSSLAPAP